MSLRASLLSVFRQPSAEDRLSDLDAKLAAAGGNLDHARAAFGEAALAVEAGIAGADRQFAKAREAVAAAESRLQELQAARGVALRAVAEARALAEAESAAQRWVDLEAHIAALRAAGKEIEDLVERLTTAQARMVAAAEAARREIPIAGETKDAISPDRLEALLRLALFKAGCAWALRTGLTPYQAPAYAAELDAALAAFTKYAPARDDARAA
jgi:hypothetical protein